MIRRQPRSTLPNTHFPYRRSSDLSEKPLYEYLEKWKNIKPFTTGDDLNHLGLKPGPKYKEILSRLRAAWLDGEISTIEEETILRDQLIAQ